MPNSSGVDLTAKIFRSHSLDPYHNLALEEELLAEVEENQVFLYLWQNEHTVVIGRNQNPWKECDCQLLESEGGKLARRLSGGGAVYHDQGNVNFTFLMPKRLYCVDKQLQIVLQAVKDLGIDASFSGRNDLLIKGKKFSGHAYYQGKNSAYHHGTILVNADFSQLSRYLTVSKEKIASKGIDSVVSRVGNLAEFVSAISVERVMQSLEAAFLKAYPFSAVQRLEGVVRPEKQVLYNKYENWSWRYGNTPNFNIEFCQRFVWGEIDLRLLVEKGMIIEATIYSDAMETEFVAQMAEQLKGVCYQKEAVLKVLAQVFSAEKEKVILADIQDWLREKVY